jgi:hypothetical protein
MSLSAQSSKGIAGLSEKHIRWLLYIAIFAAAVISLAAANRYFFTSLGLDSIGRVWQNYINYFDFGFARRSLLGTINWFFLPSPIELHRETSWILHNIFFWSFFVAFLYVTLAKMPGTSTLTKILLILNPMLIVHYAYETGHDFALAGLALFAVLMLHKLRFTILFSLIGMFVHEAFLFAYMPLLAFLIYQQTGRRAPAILYACIMGAVMLAFVAHSKLFFDTEEYTRTINTVVPNLERIGDWELSAGIVENLEFTLSSLLIAIEDPFTLMIWLLLFGYLLAFMRAFIPKVILQQQPLIYAAVWFPTIVLFFLATDIYRWVSYSAFCVYLLHLYYSRSRDMSDTFVERRPNLAFMLFAPPFLLGPLGSSCYGDCGAASFPVIVAVFDAIMAKFGYIVIF